MLRSGQAAGTRCGRAARLIKALARPLFLNTAGYLFAWFSRRRYSGWQGSKEGYVVVMNQLLVSPTAPMDVCAGLVRRGNTRLFLFCADLVRLPSLFVIIACIRHILSEHLLENCVYFVNENCFVYETRNTRPPFY